MAAKYMKLEMIGSGNFGSAWLALRKDTGKQYVMKEIQILGMTTKDKNRALTEVEALARCKHINVIRYKEAFLDSNILNIVMEYADAGDLQGRLKKQGGIYFSELLIMDWFVQICYAIRFIHGKHILHRDLKTQNIFLTSENIIKVGDFGIARILQDPAEHAQTAIGTPYYLSPEICQRLPYNHKSDMWAAGCVLYELCCLTHPFEAKDFTSLAVKISQGVFKPIPSHYSSLLMDLVRVLLTVQPDGRPSAEQVLCIPAMQQYVTLYVRRSTNVRLQQNTPSPSSTVRSNKRHMKEADTRPASPLAVSKHRAVVEETGLSPATSSVSKTDKDGRVDQDKNNNILCPSKEKENVNLETDVKRLRRISWTSPTKVTSPLLCRKTSNSAQPVKQHTDIPLPKPAPATALYREILGKKIKRSASLRDDSKTPDNDGSSPSSSRRYTEQRSSSHVNEHGSPKIYEKQTEKRGSPRDCYNIANNQVNSIKAFYNKQSSSKPRTFSSKTYTVVKQREMGNDGALEKVGRNSVRPQNKDSDANMCHSPAADAYMGHSHAADIKIQSNSSCAGVEQKQLQVCKYLYSSCVASQTDPHGNMEALSAFLEGRLGSACFQEEYSQIRQHVRDGRRFELIEADLEGDMLIYFPLICQLLQLEIFNRE